MTREEAIKTLKENLCNICSYHGKNMESCDIAYCDNRAAIRTLEQEPNIDKILARIDFEEKWLLEAGYNCSNVNTAFRSIKHDLKKWRVN